jgi:hypothetical protein
MNVEIGTETPIFLFWEYLFRNFGILSLQCEGTKSWGREFEGRLPESSYTSWIGREDDGEKCHTTRIIITNISGRKCPICVGLALVP